MLKPLSIFLYSGKGTLVWNEARVVKGTWKNKVGSHRWRGKSSSDGVCRRPSIEDFWTKNEEQGNMEEGSVSVNRQGNYFSTQ